MPGLHKSQPEPFESGIIPLEIWNAGRCQSALPLAVRASNRPRQRKSKKTVTGDILKKLLTVGACVRLVDVRDRADGHSTLLPCLRIRLGCTKTTSGDDDNEHVILIGRPMIALKLWQTEAGSSGNASHRWKADEAA